MDARKKAAASGKKKPLTKSEEKIIKVARAHAPNLDRLYRNLTTGRWK